MSKNAVMPMADYVGLCECIREKTGETSFIKSGELAEHVGNVYDSAYKKGIQAEYDRFWDSYQNNGERSSYAKAFGNAYWNRETFKPKYDLIPAKAGRMFEGFNEGNEPIDLVELLDSLDIKLDFTTLWGSNQYVFSYANISHLGVIDCAGGKRPSYVSSLAWGFEYTPIKKIDKIILNNGQIAFENAFRGMTQLEEIYFEGVIGFDVAFGQSTKLKKASIQNIVGVLSDASTNKKLTLSLTAVNTAFETSEGLADGSESEEWLNLVATKPNWTISLA